MKKYIFLAVLFLNSCTIDSTSISDINSVNQILLGTSSELNQTKHLRALYEKDKSLWPRAFVSPELEYREIGSLGPVNFPENNKYSQEKYNLGRLLFFESKLSSNNSLSCASCHNSSQNWADNLSTSIGFNNTPLKRNSPTVVNSAYHNSLFWDGRAESLEEQAIQVLLNPREMNSSEKIIQKNLGSDNIYKSLFNSAFGDSKITLERVSKSIATFERNIVTRNKSPFDQFVAGNYNALTDSQIRGMHLFRIKARCMNCHSGPNFTDNKFHNIGLVMEGTKFEDKGKIEISGKESDYGLFRTPGLRNVMKTAPYFHNGLVLNMNGVMNMYSQGMPFSKNKSKHILPIGIDSSEREDLKSFLDSLSEDIPALE